MHNERHTKAGSVLTEQPVMKFLLPGQRHLFPRDNQRLLLATSSSLRIGTGRLLIAGIREPTRSGFRLCRFAL
jgi:hypothetical protein